MSLDQMVELYRGVLKVSVQRLRTNVDTILVGIGSIIDRKVLSKFNDSLSGMLKVIEGPEGGPGPRLSKEERRRADYEHSMRELSKLGALFSKR
jgi:hypothetical protein